MVIRILDHVPTASTYEDGEAIFKLIRPQIADGLPVTVSFAGILAVPSAFVNAAFVRLIESVPMERIRECLQIVDSTRQINDMVRGRFNFVAHSKQS
jgi:hypothetical protein